MCNALQIGLKLLQVEVIATQWRQEERPIYHNWKHHSMHKGNYVEFEDVPLVAKIRMHFLPFTDLSHTSR